MQHLEHVPRHRKGHFLEEVDGENLLYGRVAMKAHYLNESASVIWKLCDGARTVGEIIDVLTDAYPDNPTIADDVHRALDQFITEGTLIVEDPSSLPKM